VRKFALILVTLILGSLIGPTVPANALVETTTLTGTIGGNPATQLAKGDVLRLKAQAPISLVGPAHQTVTTLWAPQSLELQDTDDIVYPEDWSLEYTVDGEDWSGTAPVDLSTVVGVRADGDVDTLGLGVFESSAEAEFETTDGAAGSGGGGDGYSVAFGDGTLINAYHHMNFLTMECHVITGEKCGTGEASWQVTSQDYSTTYGSNVFYDRASDHAYAFVSRDSDTVYGVACVDYSDIDAAAFCSTPFTPLSDGGAPDQYDMGNSTQDGNKIWSIDAFNATLMCFDFSLNSGDGGPCVQDNGYALGTPENGQSYSRITATQGKVFFVFNNELGCYDPSTHALCGGNEPISIGASSNRHTPMPVENADGTFLGACDITSGKCLTIEGVETTTPTALADYWDVPNNVATYAYYDMAQFVVSEHRLYYLAGSTRVSCYDYLTESSCVNFDSSLFSASLLYAVNVDPLNPDCLWTNQHSGNIVPLNAETGEIGCSLGAGSVVIPVTATATRMACDSDDEVLTWDEIHVNLPAGITSADFTLTLRDSDGAELTGFVDLTLAGDGIIDISTLDPDDTGLDPVISLEPLGDVTGEDLLPVTADVTYTAAEPEICVSLTAIPNCEGMAPDPSSPDVPDGVVRSSSETVPDAGGASVSSEAELTVSGTNTGSMCQSIVPGVPLNPLTVYFTSISPKVSPAWKNKIERLIDNNSFTNVSCAGFTQGSKTIIWLAKLRAKAVCSYAKQINPSIKTKATVNRDTGLGFTYRSVILTGR
jgi:hypothetical protein